MAGRSRPGMRSRPLRELAWISALLFGLATGCSRPEETVRLEVYSWWDVTEESRAFSTFEAVHEERHEDVDVHNETRPEASDNRARMNGLLLAGRPPATFQANIGADLLSWTKVDPVKNTLGTFTLLRDLSALYASTGLWTALPPEVVEALTVDGKPFAVPINIHRLNLIYYNVAKVEELRAAGIDLLDLATLCPENPEQTERLPISIASPARSNWTLGLWAFENVLPAVTSADFYRQTFLGNTPSAPDGSSWREGVRKALRCVRYLSRSFTTGQTWADAIRLVKSPDAAFTVAGDWANAQLERELDDGTVGYAPFPGTEDLFVFTSDSFPLPVDAEHPVEAEELLRTIASEDCQRRFNQIKGSIPARDVKLDGAVGVRAEATRRAFETSTKVLATSGLLPPHYDSDQLWSKLEILITSKTDEALEDVIDELSALSPLLQAWQELNQRPLGGVGLP